jgi:2,4-dienoyl-CoA reductase (NADPH2)
MCTACCNCWEDIAKGEPMTCTVNARAGKEEERSIIKAQQSKNVLVIGGGPGGMEAARVAALRRHRVTLFERNERLGGQLLYATVPPYKSEWNNLVQYFTNQLQKLGVELRLKEECTDKTVKIIGPDVVILATGASPFIPEVPGAKGENVVTAIDVLAGSSTVGQNVVVVGGGYVGCEVAEFLRQKDIKVTILEMLPSIGADIGPRNRWVIIDRMATAGIRMETSAEVIKITSKGVKVIRFGKYHEFFEGDTVVLSLGMEPDNNLSKKLEGKGYPLYEIGDCTKPGNVRKAIAEGFLTATRI